MPKSVQNIIPLPLFRLQKGQLIPARISRVLFLAVSLLFFKGTILAQSTGNTTLTSNSTSTIFDPPFIFTSTASQIADAQSFLPYYEVPGLSEKGISDSLLNTFDCLPVIVSQPSGYAAFAGCSPTFSVTVDGTGPFTYQWKKNGVNIADATDPTFTLDYINAGNAGNYSVVVTNACGSVTSANANLIVSSRPSASFTYGIHQWCSTVSTPQTVTRTGAAGGRYEAFPSELDIDPVTGTIIPSNSVPGTYIVTYTINPESGCPVIATRWVTVLSSPTVMINAEFCGHGGSIKLTADAVSPDPVTYVWSTGAITAEILVNRTDTYSVTATNSQGCPATSYLQINANPIAGSTQDIAVCQNELPYSWNNQSLNAAGTYTAVFQNINGCDSTVTLHLIVNPKVSTTERVTICQNELPYSWNRYLLFSSGTYTVFLKNSNGCDSTVKLQLTVNPRITNTQNITICQNLLPYAWNGQSLTSAGTYTAAFQNNNGCDSTVTLHLSVNPNVNSVQDIAICQSALPYSWNSQSVTRAGTYTVVLQNSHGCDSTVTLHLSVNQNVNSVQDIAICQSALPYSWNRQLLPGAGTYTVVLQNVNGCDSTVTLHLTVNPTINSVQNITVCHDALPYSWNRQSLPGAGTYTVVLQNSHGCDSTVTLHLTVNPTVNSVQNIAVCQDALPYRWNNQSLPGAGTYTVVLQNSHGCDSTVTLHLTVNPTVNSIQNIAVCQNALPYSWNRQSIPGAGTYTVVLQNVNGCDSTVTLHLTINPTVNSVQNIAVCQNALPYRWNNQSIPGAGTYTVVLQNSQGCDSTVTLHLTVNPTVNSVQNIAVCENALPYSWNRQSIPGAGTYTVVLQNSHGCDSTVTLHLTVNPTVNSIQNIAVCQNALPYSWNNQSIPGAGTYTVVLQNSHGCDSTVTLHLTVNPTVNSVQNIAVCQDALPYRWNNQSIPGAGTYTVVLQNSHGCDSTVTLHLTVNPTINSVQNIAVCQDALPYRWNNQSIPGAGTYTVVLQNSQGCDSTVTLHLTVNPTVNSIQNIAVCQDALPYSWNRQSIPGAGTYTVVMQNVNGCDSTVTLHLTVNPTVNSVQNIAVCQNALPYRWNNQSIPGAGTYTVVLQNVNGCDSTVTLYLTVNPNFSSTQNITICQKALPYSWNNQSLSAAGTYTALLQSVNGCDSMVTLHLTVNPNFSSMQNITICQKALPYSWNNQSLSAAGTYTALLQSVNGCDSMVTLHLTVNPNFSSVQNITICQKELPYSWNNQSLSAAGTYTALLQSINGCDSTVTLHLTVNPNLSSVQNITICQKALPYSWNNQSLSAAGTYTALLQSVNGCDSTVTLHLAVNPNLNSVQNITICQKALPYSWNNQSLSAAGTYTALLQSANGCDSTVTLHLTVNPNFSSVQNITICQKELPYSWNNQSLSAAGTYTALLQSINGCDSTVTLHLTVNPNLSSVQNITICQKALPYSWNNQSLSAAGTYTALLQSVNGCDSTVTLHLAVNPNLSSVQNITICQKALPYSWNNQSLSAAGTYTALLQSVNSCDSTVTLHLAVNPNLSSVQNITICQKALPYSWNNQSLLVAGTYTALLQSVNGCDSTVTLHLAVNPNLSSVQNITICQKALPYSWHNQSLSAAGTYTALLQSINGCDSTVTLHLTVNPNLSSVQNITICQKALPYSWNNQSLSAAGTYTALLQSINGCDSTVTLHLTVNPNLSSVQNITICQKALPYSWNNQSLLGAGTYTALLQSVNSCDSTVTLHLTVNPNLSSVQNITICQKALPYSWNNQSLSAAGTYTALLQSVNGCDSTVTLHLTVNPNLNSVQNITICQKALPYSWNNQSLSAAGTYTALLQSANGCDSTVTLHLTVNANLSSVQDITICQKALPYSWNNQSLSVAGTYTALLQSVNSCDSTVTLHLAVNPNLSSVQNITICQKAFPYSWNNQSLLVAGTYTALLQSVNGCDSTVTLYLAVNPNLSSVQNITICQKALPYSWHNQSLSAAGTYTALLQSINGCDSTVTLHLTVNPNLSSVQNITICQKALPYSWNNQSLSAAGTYTALLQSINGCDSTVTLHLTVNPNLSSVQNITICQKALPYSWNNQSLLGAGTYTALLQSVNSCDSTVTLHLTVNPNLSSVQNITICQKALPYSWNNQSLSAAGTYTALLQSANGCDSTVTLHLAVNPNLSSTQNITICQKALPYSWNNQSLSAAGTYTALLQSINGCDSTVTLHLTLNPNVNSIQNITVCESALPFIWNGQSLITAGAYTVALQNVNGCDSTVILNLSVNKNVASTQRITICQNALPYSWNGKILPGAGTATALLKSSKGCDSLVTLILTVNPNVVGQETIAVCERQLPYAWNGKTLTTAGTATATLRNIDGCDSLVTLTLIVAPTVSSQKTVTICEASLPYDWNHLSITTSGDYTATLMSAAGCDSIATLHLIINAVATGEETITICERQLPYFWNGQSLTAAGITTAMLQNSKGCDSLVTLSLVVNTNVTSSQKISVCQNALPYIWNNQSLTAAGTYTAVLQNVNGCDSTVMLRLFVNPNVINTQNITICQNALPYNWNNQSLIAAGTYMSVLQNVNGCDSTVTLNLSVNLNVASSQNITICQNALPFSWNNQSLTSAGTYTSVLQNANGCDSTATLKLVVNPTVTSSQNVTICQNALPYNWNNQSLTAAGSYTSVLQNINGCDSTLTLNLVVNPTVTNTQNLTICQNALPYNWNKQSLTAAGTYTALLQNVNGCDSTVTLKLAVNPTVTSNQNLTLCQNALPYNWNNQLLTAAGTYIALLQNVNGCDSTVTLKLVVNPTVTSSQNVTICQNALPFSWNNQSLTAAGTYTAVLQNVNGCDSIVTLNLVVNPTVTSSQNITICQNALPYNWNNQSLTAAGTYTTLLQNVNGCDSTATLKLVVNPTVTSTQNITICQNALPYNWNNQLLTAAGTYIALLQNVNGCDSTATLKLDVNPTVGSSQNITVCQNALPFSWNNQSLTATGTYTALLQNVNGCDSTATLKLVVNPTVTSSQNVTICQNSLPYNWNNQSLTAAGTYTSVLQNANGCDSTLTLNLVVNPNVTSTQNITICQNALPYNWNNQLLTAAGTYIALLQNVNGCDSTVTLKLVVNPTVTSSQNVTICQNALPYIWNNLSLTAAGTYTAVLQNVNGCDSTATLKLIVNPNVTSTQNLTICQNALPYNWNNQSLTATGTYTALLQNANGCDSTVTLNLSVNLNVASLQNITICQNSLPFSWNNQSLTSAGTYTSVLQNANGCDSTATLKLVVNPTVTSSQNVTICQNALPYRWNNQSLTAAGTYTSVLQNINGCDSTVTLKVIVNPNVTSTQNITICQNALPYNWNNQSLTITGTYTAVLQNVNGCDSTATLKLVVNPTVTSTQNITICQNALPYSWNNQSLTGAGTYTSVLQNVNGCDSTATLKLVVNPTVTSSQDVTICQNALPFSWNNQSLTATGTYTALLQNVNGCDSTATLKLVVNPTVTSSQNVTICQNALPYNWNNQSLTAAGTYTSVLQNANGCDSTLTLNLVVNPNVTSTQNITICQNALPYRWNNQSLTAAGTYTALLQNVYGCDSTATLKLDVNPTVSSSQNITVCQNALPFSWNNQSLTATGTYTSVLQNVNGCDSTVTLNLVVNPNVSSSQNVTICQNALPYNWNNQSLTAAGTYTALLQNVNGCDSTATLKLVVNPTVGSSQNITVCQNALPFSWNNQSLTATGTYTAVLQNVNGCDSTVTLKLVVNVAVASSQNITICQNALPYSWNNQSLTATGTYTAVLQNVNGCDSTVTLKLVVNVAVASSQNITICQNALPYSWNNQSLTAAGTYRSVLQNVNGCDSTVTLTLVVNLNVASSQNITICQNALPYSWNNLSLIASGEYKATLISTLGCDSIATLHLIVNPVAMSEKTITICASALPYNWNNQSIRSAGEYKVTLMSAAGCDSTATLHLIVNPVAMSEETITICASALPYNWNNRSIRSAGEYKVTLVSAAGCDSTAALHLIVNPVAMSEETITICASALPYNWNNQSIRSAGEYKITLVSAAGCDSTATLHLIVNPVAMSEETITICASTLPYNWNNQSITSAGEYKITLVSAAGCDSMATLHLIVNPVAMSEETITICASALPYNWNNQSINTAGNYTTAFQSAAGCDSIATLHLIIAVKPRVVTSAVSACTTANLTNASVTAGSDPGLIWSYWLDVAATNIIPDPTAVSAGTYYIKGVNSSGCYSIEPVTVTTNTSPVFVINSPASVCQPATVDLTAGNITAGSDPHLAFTYWMDAAATIILPNPNTIAAEGTYYIKATALNGCDFVKVMEVAVTILTGEKPVRYPTITVSPNESVQLTAREPALVNTYTWYPSVGLDYYNRKDPTFRYDKNTEYTVSIESDNGCPVVDTILIVIRPGSQACASDIFVPKAWSPNNDNHNDKLYPLTVCIKELKYFRVYNRWGQMVFETNIPGQGWDGMFHGQSQQMDTYSWRVEALGKDGKYIKREGSSVLIR